MYTKENITTLYVSQTSGRNTNSGFTPSDALASIESALDNVREIRAGGRKQPMTIRILDNEYFVTAPIKIDNEISSVIIEPQTKTKISGGIRITNFRADTFNSTPCLSAQIDQVKDGSIWFTDFYVNGKAAKFTHYPDTDFLYAKEVENNGTALYDHSKWFIAEAEDLATIKEFRNFGDCFISYNHYWIDEHTPIESYDTETGKIVFKYSSRFTIEPTHAASKLRYILENVAEAFKNPGEWYLDRPTGKLYYIPLEGETAENIVAYVPITDKLFDIRGTKDKKVCGFIIRGFDFNCTKGDYRSLYIELEKEKDIYKYDENSEGFASDIQSVCWAHGSIEMRYAHNCAIEDCTLVNMGVHAINIDEGCDHIRITNNEIRETGAGGIKIDGGEVGMDESTFTHDITVTNNLITHCGNRYFAACGILLKHAFDCEISHNEISYVYYTGISAGWTWRYEPSVAQDILIEKNHIHHLGLGKLSDMGGIYLLSEQPGTIVRGNLIHDVESKHYGGWGIYPDEGSSYILIENNICYNLSSNCFHNHYGLNNTVRNNIFAHAEKHPVQIGKGENHTSDLFENNIIVSSNTPFFHIGRMFDENDELRTELYGKPFISNKNILFDTKNNNQYFIAYSKDETERLYTKDCAENEYCIENDSIVADPLFMDYENHDYRLQSDSPAFKLGFKQIDMSDVGRIK